MLLDILCAAAGVVCVLAALNDVFQSVVVPRAVGRRFRVGFFVWRALWRIWPAIAWKLHERDEDPREDFLAIFAPFTLVLLLFVWTALLIVGYGLIFFALRSGLAPHAAALGQAIYFSGVSLSTIGFGDVVGVTAATRFLSIVAGVSGLALFSITTTYLFAVFGSFQARETFVVMVGARAGTPPSGVNLLAVAGYSQTRDDLGRLMIDGQRWVASVMESHLAYPVLAFFRSSHDYESWIGTLGTLLDAATLAMTTIEGLDAGQARIFYNLGRHATSDLARYFRVGEASTSAGLERAEFDQACERLAAAGYALHEREEAWRRFSDLRASYASNLNGMARFFLSPPLQWIGDRSSIRTH